METNDLFSDFGTENGKSSIFCIDFESYTKVCKIMNIAPNNEYTGRNIRNRLYQPTIEKILQTWKNGDINDKKKWVKTCTTSSKK